MRHARKDGGTAFPADSEGHFGPSDYHYEGMSLRDWFAGHALTGILANAAFVESSIRTAANEKQMAATLSDMAYEFADGMLAERAKERAT